VFDESHFGGFTERYLKHEYFFDIHPPMAKLTIALYVGGPGWVDGG
jgi:dolichyl-phosphate-mannose-protein mannosyltransferase